MLYLDWAWSAQHLHIPNYKLMICIYSNTPIVPTEILICSLYCIMFIFLWASTIRVQSWVKKYSSLLCVTVKDFLLRHKINCRLAACCRGSARTKNQSHALLSLTTQCVCVWHPNESLIKSKGTVRKHHSYFNRLLYIEAVNHIIFSRQRNSCKPHFAVLCVIK